MNEERKLATVQQIAEIKPIEGADKICAYRINGWWIVDSINKYQVDDKVIYCEIDSWIPHVIAPFLSKGKDPRVFNGIKGERLRTIRLKGQPSQGLLLPISTRDVVQNFAIGAMFGLGDDVTEELGIIKWEREIPAQLRGVMRGNFPTFVPKTDQERIQNLGEKYSYFQEQVMEVTEKLEGSSESVIFYNGDFHVCSRNIDLQETEGNTFWKAANKYNMRENMTNLGLNIAIQGELVGAGIQGNIYNIPDFDFYVYDVFDIDSQTYYGAEDRYALVESLGLKHVPILGYNWHQTCTNAELLQLADGKSILNPSQNREGIVLKQMNGTASFKAVSTLYLLNEKD